jgi:small conductance mechanosensitive channel
LSDPQYSDISNGRNDPAERSAGGAIDRSEARLPRQRLLCFLTLMAMICLATTAPLAEDTRSSIPSIIGLDISAAIAFSSTFFVTNFMAAITLRVTKLFNIGDFVIVGERFGMFSERGLFDTEIQTENHELISISNSVFMLSSIEVAHSSGVIVSTRLSLGYDVHRGRVAITTGCRKRSRAADTPRSNY